MMREIGTWILLALSFSGYITAFIIIYLIGYSKGRESVDREELVKVTTEVINKLLSYTEKESQDYF